MNDEAKSGPTGDAANPVKRRALNVKAIEKIAARINAMTDPVAARKRRKKLGDRLIAQIAAEEVKNPVAVAKAFMSNFAKLADAADDATDTDADAA